MTTRPVFADFAGARFIQLYLYAHRVQLWPARAELEHIKSGDQRVAAAALSLGQELAGNACVAFSMIGDLAAQRVEHYEIAAYGTVCAYAELLGESDHAELLRQTLDEEKETDEKLTELSKKINVAATQDASDDQQETKRRPGRAA